VGGRGRRNEGKRGGGSGGRGKCEHAEPHLAIFNIMKVGDHRYSTRYKGPFCTALSRKYRMNIKELRAKNKKKS